MYSWGLGSDGQLGHGTILSFPYPKAIESWKDRKKVTQLSCGHRFSVILCKNGTVWTFGSSSHGELGHGNTASKTNPTPIKDMEAGAEVSCGYVHSLLRTKTGGKLFYSHYIFPKLVIFNKTKQKPPEVYSWGSGDKGKLGHGNTSDQRTPKLVESLRGKHIRKISAGFFHSLAVSELGNVYSWGKGNKGRLGHGDEEDKNFPQLISQLVGRQVSNIAAGYSHSFACTVNGSVFSWGSNSHAQLGSSSLEHFLSPIPVEFTFSPKQITCWTTYSLALSCLCLFFLFLFLLPPIFLFLYLSFLYLSLPFLSLSLYSLFPFLYLSFVNYRSSLSFSPFSRPFSNSFFFPPLADNSLYIWGCCNNGQLGSNTTKALTPLLLQLAETKQFVLFPSLSLSISFSLPPSPFPSVPFSPLLSNSPSFLPSPIYLLPFLLHASPCPYMSLCLQIPGARIGRTKQQWKFFSFQFSWKKRAIKIRKFRKWKPGRQKDAAGIRAGKRF